MERLNVALLVHRHQTAHKPSSLFHQILNKSTVLISCDVGEMPFGGKLAKINLPADWIVDKNIASFVFSPRANKRCLLTLCTHDYFSSTSRSRLVSDCALSAAYQHCSSCAINLAKSTRTLKFYLFLAVCRFLSGNTVLNKQGMTRKSRRSAQRELTKNVQL